MRFRIAVAVLVVTVVAAVGLVRCGKADRARLVRADSLLVAEEGDSAMMILQSIDSTDLTRSNNAYYALLKTTVLYKLQQSIQSDSLINIAVRYYTNNYDQRKLTSALMYRGAVYADMNFKRMALDSYKEAEKVADTTDLMTIGLLNFNMGFLYQNSYIQNDEPIIRYKKALECFCEIKHLSFENYTLNYLGQMYMSNNYDSAYYYLNRSVDLAGQRGDKETLYLAYYHLSSLYNLANVNLIKSRDIILTIDRDSIVDNKQINSLHLARIYSKLGQIDSAKYYISTFGSPISLVDSLQYYMMLESLAVAQGDYKEAYEVYKQQDVIADTIIGRSNAEEYYAIDKQYDNSAANAKVENLSKERIIHLTIIVIVVLLFIIFIYMVWSYRKHKELALIEQQRTIDQLQSEVDRKTSSEDIFNRNMSVIDKLDKTDAEKRQLETALKEIVEQRMKMVRELLNVSHLHDAQPAKFLDQFNKIVSVNKKSQKECEYLINTTNQMYNNVIGYLSDQYPNLSNEDQLLLCLVCFEFTPVEMKVYLNLPTMQAIYSIRNRINKKIGATSLDVFIAQTKQFLAGK